MEKDVCTERCGGRGQAGYVARGRVFEADEGGKMLSELRRLACWLAGYLAGWVLFALGSGWTGRKAVQ